MADDAVKANYRTLFMKAKAHRAVRCANALTCLEGTIMRAWIVSDIHSGPMDSLLGNSLEIPQADVCICAGDVSDHIVTTISYLFRKIAPYMPVILVLGNHDYFDLSLEHVLENARRLTAGTRITLLENKAVEFGTCRFIGATLWTDFSVSVGDDDHIPPEERRARAFAEIPSIIPDHQFIRASPSFRRRSPNGMVTVEEVFQRHRRSKSYIDQALSEPTSLRSVVITHHAPHIGSFDPRFFGQVSNAAFGSDLSNLIERRRPSLWIHGHVHRFRDYMVDGTRIICNPRGFGHQREFGGFHPDFTIEL